MIEIRLATDGDAAAAGDVFYESFRDALPSVKRPHSEADIRSVVGRVFIPRFETWVAADGERVVALMVLDGDWVHQLYVATDKHGEGIGRRLLDLAKERSDGELQLWTFQVNERARRFYERNGFEAVEFTDGSGNEEHEPDVRYQWSRGQG